MSKQPSNKPGVHETIRTLVKCAEELKAEGKLDDAIKELKSEISRGDETIAVFCGGGAVNLKPMMLAICEKIHEGTYVDDQFGLCPKCRHTDGYINHKGDIWFVCIEHRVRWCVGRNPSPENDVTEEQWNRVASLWEIEPFYFSSLLSSSPFSDWLDSNLSGQQGTSERTPSGGSVG